MPDNPNRGEMVERFKAHAWKACVGNTTAGSNPVLSANRNRTRTLGGGGFFFLFLDCLVGVLFGYKRKLQITTGRKDNLSVAQNSAHRNPCDNCVGGGFFNYDLYKAGV